MAKPRRKPMSPKKTKSSKPKAKPAASKARQVTAKTKKKAKPVSKTPVKRVVKAPAKAAPRPKAKPARARGGVRPGVRVAAPAPPPRRSTYVDALAAYERGIYALQARKYREAADILQSVIAQYPDEKELHERALLYVRVCQRQLAAVPAPVESAEDRIYAATLAINNGAIDQAVTLLSSVIDKDPDHDGATYMLGVAYAIKNNAAAAIQHLARSMALNPENRDLARKEPDLEQLRRTDEMRALLASPPAPIVRKEKRPAGRVKR